MNGPVSTGRSRIVGKRLSTEPVYRDIKDGRLTIPSNFCEAASLQDGAEEGLNVTLWLVRSGRYRILTVDHVDHPEIKRLRTSIAERDGPKAPADFDDDATTVISVRLIDTSLGPGKERRLSVPDIIQNVLGIRKEGRAVVVLDGKFVEVWSVEAFEATMKIPTSDLFD